MRVVTEHVEAGAGGRQQHRVPLTGGRPGREHGSAHVDGDLRAADAIERVRQRTRVAAERAADRKSQVGSGDRSERIRTYNFPQGRVTDHRINLTLYKIDAIMDGDMEELLTALSTEHQTELLAALAEDQ